MKKTISTYFFGTVTIFVPAFVFAAPAKLSVLIEQKVLPVLDAVVGFIMTAAVAGFVWGAIKLIYSADDERGRTEGKKIMVWGLVALTCMVAVWGIVRIIKNTFLG